MPLIVLSLVVYFWETQWLVVNKYASLVCCLIKLDAWQKSDRKKQFYSKLSMPQSHHMQENQNDKTNYNPFLFHI